LSLHLAGEQRGFGQNWTLFDPGQSQKYYKIIQLFLVAGLKSIFDALLDE